MVRFLKIFISFLIVVAVTAVIVGYYFKIIPTSFKIHPELYTSGGIAIDGYDIVNFQNAKTAKKGNISYKHKFADAHWIFMSKQNMKLFIAKPNKYIPQYGGFCTYSVSQGYTYPPDPKVWTFLKGRLYLFKDEESKKLALTDWENTIAKANLNWK